MARDVDGMSVEETVEVLGVRPETVRTRLHRARRLLRAALDQRLGDTLREAFPFDGARCARMTEAVLARLGLAGPAPRRADRGVLRFGSGGRRRDRQKRQAPARRIAPAPAPWNLASIA
jgi:hypothetical protein